jgi:malonyl-CoA/methylmalonyl-CoA synthetase
MLNTKPGDLDRTQLVPQHTGRNVFPNSPLFGKLVQYAHQQPPRVVIRDVVAGIQKTHLELLTDVLALSQTIRATLGPAAPGRENEGTTICTVGLLAPGGYEYVVAFLAIVAVGACVVPLSGFLLFRRRGGTIGSRFVYKFSDHSAIGIHISAEEASYFVRKAQCRSILVASSATKLGDSLEQFFQRDGKGSTDLRFISVKVLPDTQIPRPCDLIVSSDAYLDENGPGLIIFTSGTTGPPKGAAMRRGFLYNTAVAVADFYHLTQDDVILHILPVHHATGVAVSLLPFLVVGGCVEFNSRSFDPAWLWNRWKEGSRSDDRRLTWFSGVPTIYMRMMRHYQLQIAARLPPSEVEAYVSGVRQLKGMLCGTSALPRAMQQFWTDMRSGRPILTRYGGTEIGAVLLVSPEDVSATAATVPEGSVGKIFPGLDVKLSDTVVGEILVKSPHMFSKYIFDDVATREAHDAEGYFKTGDIARRVGSYFFILGRASLDIIKSGGYKISALDVEREILGLPYIAETMVVGVPDEEFGQRVAAVVSLREEDQSQILADGQVAGGGKALTLERLRKDLRDKLSGYKLPTVLRLVEGELPKLANGKVSKKQLGPKYFPPDNYRSLPEVEVWVSKKTQARL